MTACRPRSAWLFVILVIVFSIPTRWAWSTNYDAYYLFSHAYPDNTETSWANDNAAASGIAHDDNNWYIVSLGTDFFNESEDETLYRFWKIPVSVDLQKGDLANEPGVLTYNRSQLPLLDKGGFTHPGDLDHYKFGGKDYLLVPVRNNNNSPSTPAIAAFLGPTLSGLDVADLVGLDQTGIGWCAIGPGGELYTSEDDATAILEYQVDWPTLATTGKLIIQPVKAHPLVDSSENGLKLYNMQGGELSVHGDFLYVVSGIALRAQHDSDGIHVFERSSSLDRWHEVERSTNRARGQAGPFDYTYIGGFNSDQEPEGLTVWDLDNGRAPGISGQLHVFLFNWQITSDNLVSLKHYSGKIRVDRASVDTPRLSIPYPGTAGGPPAYGRPFGRFVDAVTFYPAWDGVEFLVEGGSYPGPVRVKNRSRIDARDGVVIIGK